MFKGFGTLRRSEGFTLLEILVALTLIGLLVGALAPTVLNQLNRGEENRIIEDLRAIENGVKLFRIDVRRWPGDIEDLTSSISTTENDFDSSAYPAGIVSRWDGTYLEGVALTDGDSISTGGGGQIQDNFSSYTLGDDTYLSVEITNLTSATIAAVSEAVDGDTDVTDTDAGGRVREDSGALIYLAVPTN